MNALIALAAISLVSGQFRYTYITNGPCLSSGDQYPSPCNPVTPIPSSSNSITLWLTVFDANYTVLGFIIVNPNGLPECVPAQNTYLGDNKWKLHWNSSPPGNDAFVRIEVWDYQSGGQLLEQVDIPIGSRITLPCCPPCGRLKRRPRLRSLLPFARWYPLETPPTYPVSTFQRVAKASPSFKHPKHNSEHLDVDPDYCIGGCGPKDEADHVFGYTLRFNAPTNGWPTYSNPSVKAASCDSSNDPKNWKISFKTHVESSKKLEQWLVVEVATSGDKRKNKINVKVKGK